MRIFRCKQSSPFIYDIFAACCYKFRYVGIRHLFSHDGSLVTELLSRNLYLRIYCRYAVSSLWGGVLTNSIGWLFNNGEANSSFKSMMEFERKCIKSYFVHKIMKANHSLPQLLLKKFNETRNFPLPVSKTARAWGGEGTLLGGRRGGRARNFQNFILSCSECAWLWYCNDHFIDVAIIHFFPTKSSWFRHRKRLFSDGVVFSIGLNFFGTGYLSFQNFFLAIFERNIPSQNLLISPWRTYPVMDK